VKGLEVGKVGGDLSVESTVNQIENRIVQGEYVDRRIIVNLLVNDPRSLDPLLQKLTAALGVGKTTLRNPEKLDVPENVSRQIAEVMGAQKEAATRGVSPTPQADYRLGMLAAHNRNYEEALKYFRRASRSDPEFSDPFEAIAWLQQSRARDDFIIRRDYPSAARRLEEARQAAMHTDPLDGDALSLRGYIAGTLAQIAEATHDEPQRRKYHAEAARLFGHAVRLNPANPSAQKGLGTAEHETGNLDSAISAYLRAIELAPDYVSAHHDLAIAYEDKMKADPAQKNEWRQRALAAWRKTYELAPTDAGFSAEYILQIGQRIVRLDRERQEAEDKTRESG
ncbi:MAG TPA: tetratricopeptide repeat protein, partial [Syntrophales bacterium]